MADEKKGTDATIQEIRQANGAFTRILEETKMGVDAAWPFSRMLRKLRSAVKQFEKDQLKQYKDHGGMVDGQGISMPPLIEKQKDESLAAWEKRLDAHRKNVNSLSEQLETLNEKTVTIELEPIKRSSLPKKRKNKDGEDEVVEYRATDFANCGPFLVDDSETKE